MNKRFDLLERTFETPMNTQSALTERLVAVEEQGSEHEWHIQTLELCLEFMKKSNERLLIKFDDLEGHSRHNNIKIVGILEGEEKGRPREFIAGLIPKLLGMSNFAQPMLVDRVRCVPVPKPTDAKRSWTHHRQDSILPGERIDSTTESATTGELQWS